MKNCKVKGVYGDACSGCEICLYRQEYVDGTELNGKSREYLEFTASMVEQSGCEQATKVATEIRQRII